MSKVKILLFEDSDDDIQLISEILYENNFEIVGIAKSFNQGIELIKSIEFDIVIIDILIEKKPEGILFAYEIPNNVPFIFLTSSLDKDIFDKAKLTNPYSYLIKPFNQLELLFSIDLALEKATSGEGSFKNENLIYHDQSFFVKKRRALIKIKLDEILYVSVEGQYCKIITEQGKFLIHISLNKFIKQIPKTFFYRTHRNFLVNINKIHKIYPEDNLIIIDNKEKVLISRRFKSDFLKKYDIFK